MTNERTLTPKNWTTFQHYKDRRPQWIKLHKTLLDDPVFNRLPVASQALAPKLWLLASEHDDGAITLTHDEIAYRLRISTAELDKALSPLVEAQYFDLSGGLDAQPDEAARFDPVNAVKSGSSAPPAQIIYDAYPRKVAKPEAIKAIDKAIVRLRKSNVVEPEEWLLTRTEHFAQTRVGEDPNFTPHPSTWYNQERYNDDPKTWKDREQTGFKPKYEPPSFAPAYPIVKAGKELTDEQIARNKEIIATEMSKMKELFK